MDVTTSNKDLEKIFLTNSSSDIDFLALEMQQREFLYELQRKRKQLDECRQELNEAEAKQHELERELEKEVRRNECNNLQLTTLADIATALKDQRKGEEENSNKQKIQLELLSMEREALVKQNHSLQHENMNLKRELENAEDKIKCFSAFQKDILDQQAKLHVTVSEVVSSHKNLSNDMEYLKKIENDLEKFLDLKLYAEQCEEEKNKTLDMMKNMEKELIMKTAELDTFKELLESSPLTADIDEDILNFWKEKSKELQQLLKQEAESALKLTTALETANETRLILEKSYEAAVDKIKILENEKSENTILKIDVETQTDAPDKEIDETTDEDN